MSAIILDRNYYDYLTSHFEFADNWRYLKEHPLEKTGDILILAGDIGYLGDDNYSSHPFWDMVADQYEQVLVVPGNHEFYKFYDIASLPDGELLRSGLLDIRSFT